MADLELCFYSKCLRPSCGRLTLKTQAGYTSTDSRNKRRLAAGYDSYAGKWSCKGNNGICWIKMRRGDGWRLMRQVIVHYPTAHPRLTWLYMTSTAFNNIPNITLAASVCNMPNCIFKLVFPAYSYSLYSFHLWHIMFLWNHSVCSSVLISQM